MPDENDFELSSRHLAIKSLEDVLLYIDWIQAATAEMEMGDFIVAEQTPQSPDHLVYGYVMWWLAQINEECESVARVYKNRKSDMALPQVMADLDYHRNKTVHEYGKVDERELNVRNAAQFIWEDLPTLRKEAEDMLQKERDFVSRHKKSKTN